MVCRIRARAPPAGGRGGDGDRRKLRRRDGGTDRQARAGSGAAVKAVTRAPAWICRNGFAPARPRRRRAMYTSRPEFTAAAAHAQARSRIAKSGAPARSRGLRAPEAGAAPTARRERRGDGARRLPRAAPSSEATCENRPRMEAPMISDDAQVTYTPRCSLPVKMAGSVRRSPRCRRPSLRVAASSRPRPT